MSNHSPELQPVKELRRAVTSGSVSFLAQRPILRAFFGIIGAILFLIGLITAPLWNVPLLSWLNGSQVASTCLAGGLVALGIWYLSGRGGVSSAPVPAVETPRNSDLADQLERLRTLHSSGDLSDEEYMRAKSRVIDT